MHTAAQDSRLSLHLQDPDAGTSLGILRELWGELKCSHFCAQHSFYFLPFHPSSRGFSSRTESSLWPISSSAPACGLVEAPHGWTTPTREQRPQHDWGTRMSIASTAEPGATHGPGVCIPLEGHLACWEEFRKHLGECSWRKKRWRELIYKYINE